jgi:hypothetical protein
MTYSIYRLELVTSLIYPKPDAMAKYMLDVVS